MESVKQKGMEQGVEGLCVINQFKMMTNNSHNPLTSVPTNPHSDVSVSVINNHNCSILFVYVHSDIKYNAFYQYLDVTKSTSISNKVINTFLITFSSWRLKYTNNWVFVQNSTFLPPILSQHGPHQHKRLIQYNYNESAFSIFISFILYGSSHSLIQFAHEQNQNRFKLICSWT